MQGNILLNHFLDGLNRLFLNLNDAAVQTVVNFYTFNQELVRIYDFLQDFYAFTRTKPVVHVLSQQEL